MSLFKWINVYLSPILIFVRLKRSHGRNVTKRKVSYIAIMFKFKLFQIRNFQVIFSFDFCNLYFNNNLFTINFRSLTLS